MMNFLHPALTWSEQDVRDSVDQLEEADQEKFYKKVAESDRDLEDYFQCLLDDRADVIIDFIKQQIESAISETLADSDE